MGDPLSVTASVAGLVSLGLQTTQYLYQYYTACHDRDEDLSRTTDQLNDLLQTFRIINDTICKKRTWRSNEDQALRHIETSITHCGDVIYELEDEMKKYQKEPAVTFLGKIKAVGRRAAYPFRESTLKKLDEDVSDLRGNLLTVLQALGLGENSNIQDAIQDVKHIVQHAQAQHLTASVRDWLRAPDASVDFNAACAKRHAGTGQWLIRSDAFTTWLEQANSFRWLHGFADCGKSVLCATTIEYTFRRQQAGNAVAFFFFTFTDESKQDASALLRTLLSQLSGRVSGLEADLSRLRESYKTATPPVSVLMEHLRQAVVRAQHVYILLDALDESPLQSSRADVLTVLETMRQWSLPGLHLLVTSRDEPDIRDRLQSSNYDRDYVALRNESVQEDIRRYVSYQVDHDPQLRRWGDRREKIKEHLTRHASGVFRWVDCQLEPLRRCPQSMKYLEQCLSTLPRSLDATYERILCGISDESQEDAQRMLSLLCLSARPPSVAEVIEVLAVDINDLECYDSDRRLERADDLRRICPGLIEIVNHKAYDDDIDNGYSDNKNKGDQEIILSSNIVRIAHFSVQEYLVSDRIQTGLAAGFAVTGHTQHSQISKTCLLYLLHDDFLQLPLTRDLVRQYPLARFAAQYWHYHYRQVDSELAEQLTELATILVLSDDSLERWIRLYNPYTDRDRKVIYDTEALNPNSSIYYASLLGLDQVVESILLKSQAQVNAQGGVYGTALQVASRQGHEKIVQILLKAGAEVNARGDNDTALQVASRQGHEKIVQILLEAGAEVNTQGEESYSTALQAASRQGHEKIVQTLLEAGAEVNARGDNGTALQVASAGGHEKVVRLLLEAGADVNMPGVYGTALQVAAEEGHEKVVQILIEAGAEIDARGGGYGTALRVARRQGYEKIVQMLLEAGAGADT